MYYHNYEARKNIFNHNYNGLCNVNPLYIIRSKRLVSYIIYIAYKHVPNTLIQTYI